MNLYTIIRTMCFMLVVVLWGNVVVYASDTDERIEAAAQNSYVFKTYLKDESVHVNSNEGAVTLKGTVNSIGHKALAEETVSGLPGVNRVDSQLDIKGENPEQYSDAWVGIKVKSALLFRRNVSGLNTEVNVQEGVVTLRGEADNQAQKDLTTEYVKDIEGVQGVNNDMTIASPPKPPQETLGEKIDDASITAQAKLALAYHRSTSALRVGVKTDDGVVTVSGKAKNAAEKDLVTKVVSDIKGVKNVVNTMTVG